jgi:hypothetical protein
LNKPSSRRSGRKCGAQQRGEYPKRQRHLLHNKPAVQFGAITLIPLTPFGRTAKGGSIG